MKSQKQVFLSYALLFAACSGSPAEQAPQPDSSQDLRGTQGDEIPPERAAPPAAIEEANADADSRTEPAPIEVEKTVLDAGKREYPWLEGDPGETIVDRFPPPKGFKRTSSEPGSFANWLRHLPLKPGVPEVLLFDGTPKGYQGAQAAVVQMDVGKRDLQQCVDACMRLRAEYLFFAKRHNKICFRAVSGDKMTFTGGANYPAFRKYMNKVFNSANTRSMLKMMKKVDDIEHPEIGQIYLNRPDPNSYGHAVTVMDTATDNTGRTAILLSQSYMPAQEIHILKNPRNEALSPWYIVAETEDLRTPEWRFYWEDLHRYPNRGCRD